MGTIAENLAIVRQKVRDSTLSCGRNPDDVLIVAVSKTFGEEAIKSAFEAGQLDFGENYAQEFKRKCVGLDDLQLRWHFIGHLQSNKAREVVGKTHLIHSLDRISLARELQKRAEASDVTVDVLIEVHTTDEATKSGVMPDALTPFARDLSAFDRVRVRGLMTMGPFSEDPEAARPCFAALRQLRDSLRQEAPSGIACEELSMGMTADFPVAIQEGATILRIGTAIFGQRTPHGQ